jgi:hypothetical protein
MKARKKRLAGWLWEDDTFDFENIDAYGRVMALNLTVLKHKKDLGKVKGVKVYITTELPTTKKEGRDGKSNTTRY